MARDRVRGYCPACGGDSLFVGAGGYITCSWSDCERPDAASDVLEQRGTPETTCHVMWGRFGCERPSGHTGRHHADVGVGTATWGGSDE